MEYIVSVYCPSNSIMIFLTVRRGCCRLKKKIQSKQFIFLKPFNVVSVMVMRVGGGGFLSEHNNFSSSSASTCVSVCTFEQTAALSPRHNVINTCESSRLHFYRDQNRWLFLTIAYIFFSIIYLFSTEICKQLLTHEVNQAFSHTKYNQLLLQ